MITCVAFHCFLFGVGRSQVTASQRVGVVCLLCVVSFVSSSVVVLIDVVTTSWSLLSSASSSWWWWLVAVLQYCVCRGRFCWVVMAMGVDVAVAFVVTVVALCLFCPCCG